MGAVPYPVYRKRSVTKKEEDAKISSGLGVISPRDFSRWDLSYSGMSGL